MVVTTRKNTEGIKAPTITIAALNPDTKLGWRTNMTGVMMCSNVENISDCIAEKTFNQDEVFKDIVFGFTTKKYLRKEKNMFSVDFTESQIGRTYSINTLRNMTPNYSRDQIFIISGYDYILHIFLHDPSFFIYNVNPIGLPYLSLMIDPNKTSNQYHWLTMTEVEELDLPEDPCNTNPDYNFQVSITKNRH